MKAIELEQFHPQEHQYVLKGARTTVKLMQVAPEGLLTNID